MAGFVLTAQIQLQAPRNLSTVVNQIKSQLSGVSVPVNVTIPASASTRVAAISKTLSGVTKQAQTATSGMQSFGKAAALAAKRFAGFTLATSVFIAFARAMKAGVGDAISFEKELIKISQVTGKSIAGLKGLTSEVTSLSKEFGVAAGEILQVSRVLAQAGLSAEDTATAMRAITKTELASTFGNIATTAEGAIAILRQFGKGVESLEGQLSAINAVSKSFAVESEDIIKAVRRTGGVFQAAGGDLNEFIALFTSVRATTRETAETIATGLRTIFTRIQRPQTIEFLKQFGVQLQDLSGNFVGPFEAVKRLSNALKGLPKTSVLFAAIAEQLGGFRQIGKVIPLLQQFETSELALGKAMRGTTSLTSDATKMQQSMAVQIAKVREEFGQLTRKIADSRSFRTMIDVALKLSSAFIKVVDSLTPLIPLIATLGAIKLGGALAGFAKGFRMGIPEFQKGGRVKKFARGGVVPGTGNTDSVPAMLTPGEFVIKKSSVKSIGADRLHKMNKRGRGGPIRRGRGGSIRRRRYLDGGEADFDWANVTVEQLEPTVGRQRAQTIVKAPFASQRKNLYAKAQKLAAPKKAKPQQVTGQKATGTGGKFAHSKQLIEVDTRDNVGVVFIDKSDVGGGSPVRMEGGAGRVAQEMRKGSQTFTKYARNKYPKGRIAVGGNVRVFDIKDSVTKGIGQVDKEARASMKRVATERGATGDVGKSIEEGMAEQAEAVRGAMGEALIRSIAGETRGGSGGLFEFTGGHKNNPQWNKVIQDGQLSAFKKTKYVDIKNENNKRSRASLLSKAIGSGFQYKRRGGKIQRLQDGGGVKGGHYFVSSDSEAFKSWTDIQAFIGEIVKSNKETGHKAKMNFVAGPSGSGKSFATRGLSMITNRADAAEHGDAFTFEFAGNKLENIAPLLKQVKRTRGSGYWLETSDETVQAQRAKRLAGHSPTARDARSVKRMKQATDYAKLPSSEQVTGFLAELKNAFPALQITSSGDVQLQEFADGGKVNLKIKDTVGLLARSGSSSERLVTRTGRGQRATKSEEIVPTEGVIKSLRSAAIIGDPLKRAVDPAGKTLAPEGTLQAKNPTFRKITGALKADAIKAAVGDYISLSANVDADVLRGDISTSKLVEKVIAESTIKFGPGGTGLEIKPENILPSYRRIVDNALNSETRLGDSNKQIIRANMARKFRQFALKDLKKGEPAGTTAIAAAAGQGQEDALRVAMRMSPERIKRLFNEQDTDDFDFPNLTVAQQDLLSGLIVGAPTARHVGDGSKVASSDAKPNTGPYEQMDLVKKAFNYGFPFTGAASLEDAGKKAIKLALADEGSPLSSALTEDQKAALKLNEGGKVPSILRGAWRMKVADRLMDELGINVAMKGVLGEHWAPIKKTQEPKREYLTDKLGREGRTVPLGSSTPTMIDVLPNESDKIMGMLKSVSTNNKIRKAAHDFMDTDAYVWEDLKDRDAEGLTQSLNDYIAHSRNVNNLLEQEYGANVDWIGPNPREQRGANAETYIESVLKAAEAERLIDAAMVEMKKRDIGDKGWTGEPGKRHMLFSGYTGARAQQIEKKLGLEPMGLHDQANWPDLIGKEFSIAGILSTSDIKEVSERFGGLEAGSGLLNIKTKDEFLGADLRGIDPEYDWSGTHSEYVESEILLPAGSKFRIDQIKPRGRLKEMSAEQGREFSIPSMLVQQLVEGGKVFQMKSTGWTQADGPPTHQQKGRGAWQTRLGNRIYNEVQQEMFGKTPYSSETEDERIAREKKLKKLTWTKQFMDQLIARTKARMAESDYVWEMTQEEADKQGQHGPAGLDFTKSQAEKDNPYVSTQWGSLQKYQASTRDLGSLLAGRYDLIGLPTDLRDQLGQAVRAAELVELMDRAMVPMKGEDVETLMTLEDARYQTPPDQRAASTGKKTFGTAYHGIYGARAENLKKQLSQGSTFSFPGFMSVSTHAATSDSWRSHNVEKLSKQRGNWGKAILNGMIEIALKPDFIAGDMRKRGKFGAEEEILLPRNSQFKATEIQGLLTPSGTGGPQQNPSDPFLVKAQQLKDGGKAKAAEKSFIDKLPYIKRTLLSDGGGGNYPEPLYSFSSNSKIPPGMDKRPANWPKPGEELTTIDGYLEHLEPYVGFHVMHSSPMDKKYRGQGWGSAAYANLAKMYKAKGVSGFYSDTSVSAPASKVWDNLSKHYPSIFPSGIQLLDLSQRKKLQNIREGKLAPGTETALFSEGATEGSDMGPVFGTDWRETQKLKDGGKTKKTGLLTRRSPYRETGKWSSPSVREIIPTNELNRKQVQKLKKLWGTESAKEAIAKYSQKIDQDLASGKLRKNDFGSLMRAERNVLPEVLGGILPDSDVTGQPYRYGDITEALAMYGLEFGGTTGLLPGALLGWAAGGVAGASLDLGLMGIEGATRLGGVLGKAGIGVTGLLAKSLWSGSKQLGSSIWKGVVVPSYENFAGLLREDMAISSDGPGPWGQEKARGGKIQRFAKGGGVGTDTVPALLTPGEFVINKKSAQSIGYGKLNHMNDVGKFAAGGVVGFQDGGGVGTGQLGGGFQLAALTVAIDALTRTASQFFELSEETQKVVDKYTKLATTAVVTAVAFSAFAVKINKGVLGIKNFREGIYKSIAAGKFSREGILAAHRQRQKDKEIEKKGVSEFVEKLAELDVEEIKKMGLSSDQESSAIAEIEEAAAKNKEFEEAKGRRAARLAKLEGVSTAAAAATLAVLVTTANNAAEEFDRLSQEAIKAGDANRAASEAMKAASASFDAQLRTVSAGVGGSLLSVFGPLGTAIGAIAGTALAASGALNNFSDVAIRRSNAMREAEFKAKDDAKSQKLTDQLKGLATAEKLETDPEKIAAIQQKRSDLIMTKATRSDRTGEVARGALESQAMASRKDFDRRVKEMREIGGFTPQQIQAQARDESTELGALAMRAAEEGSASVFGLQGMTEETKQFTPEKMFEGMTDFSDEIEADRRAADAARILAEQFERTREKLKLFDAVGAHLEALSVSTTQLSTAMNDSFALMSGQSKISATVAKVSTFDIAKSPDAAALNAEIRAIGAQMGDAGDKLAEDFIATSSVFKDLGPKLNDVVEGSIDAQQKAYREDIEARKDLRDKIKLEKQKAPADQDKAKIEKMEKDLSKMGSDSPRPRQEFFGDLLNEAFKDVPDDLRKTLVAEGKELLVKSLEGGKLKTGAETEIIEKLKKSIGLDKDEKFFKDTQAKQFKEIDKFVNDFNSLLGAQLKVSQGIIGVMDLELKSREMILKAQGKDPLSLDEVSQQRRTRRNFMLMGTGAAGMGGDLGGVTRNALALQAKIDKERIALNKGANQTDKAAFKDRKANLARLQNEFVRVQGVLKDFGDVTKEVSAVQARLSKVQAERETRRGFIKEFAFGDTDQRKQMLQARSGAMFASRTGNINAVPEQLRGAVGSLLDRFKDVRLPEFGGSTGDELSKVLEANVLRQMGASEQMISAVLQEMPEEEKLINELKILGLQEQQASLANLAIQAQQQNVFHQRLMEWADRLDASLKRLGGEAETRGAVALGSQHGGVGPGGRGALSGKRKSGRIGGKPGIDKNLTLVGNREVILTERDAREIGPTLEGIGVRGVGRNFKRSHAGGVGPGGHGWMRLVGQPQGGRMNPQQMQNFLLQQLMLKQQQINQLQGQNQQVAPVRNNMGFKNPKRLKQYRKDFSKRSKRIAKARAIFYKNPNNRGRAFWADDPQTPRQAYAAGYGSQAGGEGKIQGSSPWGKPPEGWMDVTPTGSVTAAAAQQVKAQEASSNQAVNKVVQSGGAVTPSSLDPKAGAVTPTLLDPKAKSGPSASGPGSRSHSRIQVKKINEALNRGDLKGAKAALQSLQGPSRATWQKVIEKFEDPKPTADGKSTKGAALLEKRKDTAARKFKPEISGRIASRKNLNRVMTDKTTTFEEKLASMKAINRRVADEARTRNDISSKNYNERVKKDKAAAAARKAQDEKEAEDARVKRQEAHAKQIADEAQQRKVAADAQKKRDDELTRSMARTENFQIADSAGKQDSFMVAKSFLANSHFDPVKAEEDATAHIEAIEIEMKKAGKTSVVKDYPLSVVRRLAGLWGSLDHLREMRKQIDKEGDKTGGTHISGGTFVAGAHELQAQEVKGVQARMNVNAKPGETGSLHDILKNQEYDKIGNRIVPNNPAAATKVYDPKFAALNKAEAAKRAEAPHLPVSVLMPMLKKAREDHVALIAEYENAFPAGDSDPSTLPPEQRKAREQQELSFLARLKSSERGIGLLKSTLTKSAEAEGNIIQMGREQATSKKVRANQDDFNRHVGLFGALDVAGLRKYDEMHDSDSWQGMATEYIGGVQGTVEDEIKVLDRGARTLTAATGAVGGSLGMMIADTDWIMKGLVGYSDEERAAFKNVYERYTNASKEDLVKTFEGLDAESRHQKIFNEFRTALGKDKDFGGAAQVAMTAFGVISDLATEAAAGAGMDKLIKAAPAATEALKHAAGTAKEGVVKIAAKKVAKDATTEAGARATQDAVEQSLKGLDDAAIATVDMAPIDRVVDKSLQQFASVDDKILNVGNLGDVTLNKKVISFAEANQMTPKARRLFTKYGGKITKPTVKGPITEARFDKLTRTRQNLFLESGGVVENASLKGVRKTLTQEGFDRLTAAQQKSFMRAVEKGDAALARSELTGTSRTVTTGGPGGRADMVIKQPPKMTRTQYKNLNPREARLFQKNGGLVLEDSALGVTDKFSTKSNSALKEVWKRTDPELRAQALKRTGSGSFDDLMKDASGRERLIQALREADEIKNTRELAKQASIELDPSGKALDKMERISVDELIDSPLPDSGRRTFLDTPEKAKTPFFDLKTGFKMPTLRKWLKKVMGWSLTAGGGGAAFQGATTGEVGGELTGGAFPLEDIATLGIPGKAAGGLIGGRPGIDRNLIRVTKGEAVVNASQQAALASMAGGSVGGVFAAAGVPGFGANAANTSGAAAAGFRFKEREMDAATLGVAPGIGRVSEMQEREAAKAKRETEAKPASDGRGFLALARDKEAEDAKAKAKAEAEAKAAEAEAKAKREAEQRKSLRGGGIRQAGSGKLRHKTQREMRREEARERRTRGLLTGRILARTPEDKKRLEKAGRGGMSQKQIKAKFRADFKAGKVDKRGRRVQQQRPDAGHVRPGPGGPPQQQQQQPGSAAAMAASGGFEPVRPGSAAAAGGPPPPPRLLARPGQQGAGQQQQQPQPGSAQAAFAAFGQNPFSGPAATQQMQQTVDEWRAQGMSPTQAMQQALNPAQQQAMVASGQAPGMSLAPAAGGFGQARAGGQQGQQGQAGGQQMPDIAAFSQAMTKLVEGVTAVGQSIGATIEKLAGFQLQHEHNHSGTINIEGVENAKQAISDAIIEDVKAAIDEKINNLSISTNASGKSELNNGGATPNANN